MALPFELEFSLLDGRFSISLKSQRGAAGKAVLPLSFAFCLINMQVDTYTHHLRGELKCFMATVKCLPPLCLAVAEGYLQES